jgi:hypothetical protein
MQPVEKTGQLSAPRSARRSEKRWPAVERPPERRRFHGQAVRLEYNSFWRPGAVGWRESYVHRQLGAASPGKAVLKPALEITAATIVKGVERRPRRVAIGNDARAVAVVGRLAPVLSAAVLTRISGRAR